MTGSYYSCSLWKAEGSATSRPSKASIVSRHHRASPTHPGVHRDHQFASTLHWQGIASCVAR